METRICPKCGSEMDYEGADVRRDDTGEHYLCALVHEWTCSDLFCNGVIHVLEGDSWTEEYDDRSTWRDHDTMGREATERMAETYRVMWEALKQQLDDAIVMTEKLRAMLPNVPPQTELDAFKKVLSIMQELEAE